MTFTYLGTLATSLDKVRFLIGDTASASPKFTDEEIAGVLAMQTNVYHAAATLAERLSGDLASRVDISIDGASFDYSGQAQRYSDLARSLRSQASMSAGGLGLPKVGGLSIAEITSAEQDSDRAANDGFMRDQFTNHGNVDGESA